MGSELPHRAASRAHQYLPSRTRPERSRGYALLVVLLLLSLFVLALAEAVPSMKVQIERSRENVMITRAREYRLAIQRYFHKYGHYPPSIDDLLHEDAYGLRYLREPWPDPLAPRSEDDVNTGAIFHGWQVIHYGQANPAEIVDQPPGATTAAGIAGPNLTVGSAAANTGIVTGRGTGSPTTGPGSASNGMSGPGSTTSPAMATSGPVIGVASSSKQPAIHAFNGSDIPNDWEFVYNYADDPTLRTAAGTAAGQGLIPGRGATPTGAPGTASQPSPSPSPGGSAFPTPGGTRP